jgi:hypothetical protein
MQRTVGCGEQMSKMTILDFENRMGIKDPMHRKKLFLAMCTRQVNHLFSSILLGWNDGKCNLQYISQKHFFAAQNSFSGTLFLVSVRKIKIHVYHSWHTS